MSGFRNFKDEITIQSDDLKGALIVLVGKNGTGKSTILEVINHLLGSTNFNQLATEKYMRTMDVDSGARFYISVEIPINERESLKKQLISFDNHRKELISKSIDETFATKNHFELEIKITYDPLNVQNKYQMESLLDGKSISGNSDAHWLQVAKSSRILVAYSGRLGSLTLDSFNSLNSQQILLAGQFTGVNSDDGSNSGRLSSANINMNNILNSIASQSLWEKLKSDDGKLLNLDLDKDLEKISSIISPLEINYDSEVLKETGVFNFYLKNTTAEKPTEYPVGDASSGEKQALYLWGLINAFTKHDFKPFLLIDEPDNSLHPDFVSRIASYLKETLKNQHSGLCIVATHSIDFVQANPQNVYRVNSDRKNISRIQGLEERINLFEGLGRPLDMSYLVDKIIFVEGVLGGKGADGHMPDWEIYQELVDPLREQVAFLPAGSKPGVISARDHMQLIAEQIQIADSEKVIALVDGDGENTPEKTVATPYHTVENVFIANTTILEESIKEFLSDDEFDLSAITGLSITDPLSDNGKKHMKKIHAHLRANETYKTKGGLSGLERLIISKIKDDMAVLPNEMTEFLEGLKI